MLSFGRSVFATRLADHVPNFGPGLRRQLTDLRYPLALGRPELGPHPLQGLGDLRLGDSQRLRDPADFIKARADAAVLDARERRPDDPGPAGELCLGEPLALSDVAQVSKGGGLHDF